MPIASSADCAKGGNAGHGGRGRPRSRAYRTLIVPSRTSSPPLSGPAVTVAIRRARESYRPRPTVYSPAGVCGGTWSDEVRKTQRPGTQVDVPPLPPPSDRSVWSTSRPSRSRKNVTARQSTPVGAVPSHSTVRFVLAPAHSSPRASPSCRSVSSPRPDAIQSGSARAGRKLRRPGHEHDGAGGPESYRRVQGRVPEEVSWPGAAPEE